MMKGLAKAPTAKVVCRMFRYFVELFVATFIARLLMIVTVPFVMPRTNTSRYMKATGGWIVSSNMTIGERPVMATTTARCEKWRFASG